MRIILALCGLLLAAPALAAPTTWNSADKDTAVTLSGGDLIATQAAAANSWRGVRSNNSFTVGGSEKKIYKLNVTAGATGWIGGFANASWSLTAVLGAGGVSMGIQAGVGNQFVNGLTGTTGCGGANSGITSTWIAIDFATGNIWCERNTCANWNSTNNGNPGTGSNPAYVIPGSTVVFIAWSGFDNESDIATIVPSPDTSGCTNISGFTTWDVAGGAATHTLPTLGAGR